MWLGFQAGADLPAKTPKAPWSDQSGPIWPLALRRSKVEPLLYQTTNAPKKKPKDERAIYGPSKGERAGCDLCSSAGTEEATSHVRTKFPRSGST